MPAYPDTIIIIDAFAQIYRGYYAIRQLTNSKQQPVNAIFAMAKLLLKLEHNFPSSSGAFVFDLGKPAFRTALAPDYKANRPPMPDELRQQLDSINELIAAFGWPRFGSEGFEADDVIAALAADITDRDILIFSSDKDLAQIITSRVKMAVPQRQGRYDIRGYDEIITKYQVKPEQIVDYLAMLGDSADNIPGVPGIGPKTAAALLQEHGSITMMLAHPERIARQQLRDKILAHAELLKKNQQLVTLNINVPERPWLQSNGLSRRQPDWQKIHNFCEEFELKSIIREIDAIIAKNEPSAYHEADGKFAPDLFA